MPPSASWDIDDDAAWVRVGPGSYRHYSGVSIVQKGKLWFGASPDGDLLSGRKTSLDAAAGLQKKGLWWLHQFDAWSREYGPVRHTLSPVTTEEPMHFVFWVSPDAEFPAFVKSTLTRQFFGKAECGGCSATLASFRQRTVHRFDGPSEIERNYLVCECGYPVWRMPWNEFDGAFNAMERGCREWRRRKMLAEAGGKHTRAELREILNCQENRCIYCHAEFTAERRPTRDHLLPLTKGGGDWAMNIVLACHSCNSRRGNLAFRTFCKVLSPAQNKRIFMHLIRRLQALTRETVTEDAIVCFDAALAQHNLRDLRYRIVKKSQYRNAKANKLLPRSAVAILNTYVNMQGKTLRDLRDAKVGRSSRARSNS